jgi:glycerophosphoryl diester phosphodiesterase
LTGAVQAAGGQGVADKLFLECFEIWPLREAVASAPFKWNCVQLIAARYGPLDQPGMAYADMLTDEGLARVAEYAGAISVEKPLILPRDTDNRSLPPTGLSARAQRAGLSVLAWTFRAENKFLPADLQRGDPGAPDFQRQHGDLNAELRAAYAAGVDGVFCDFPGMAVAARA